jgi:hypothetical protein
MPKDRRYAEIFRDNQRGDEWVYLAQAAYAAYQEQLAKVRPPHFVLDWQFLTDADKATWGFVARAVALKSEKLKSSGVSLRKH